MTNVELKDKISEIIMDDDILDRVVVLEGDEFADGVIGISIDDRLVYSYEKLVDSLAKSYMQGDIKEEDEARSAAIDWLEYNTIRSLSYMESQGSNAPIIIHEM